MLMFMFMFIQAKQNYLNNPGFPAFPDSRHPEWFPPCKLTRSSGPNRNLRLSAFQCKWFAVSEAHQNATAITHAKAIIKIKIINSSHLLPQPRTQHPQRDFPSRQHFSLFANYAINIITRIIKRRIPRTARTHSRTHTRSRAGEKKATGVKLKILPLSLHNTPNDFYSFQIFPKARKKRVDRLRGP